VVRLSDRETEGHRGALGIWFTPDDRPIATTYRSKLGGRWQRWRGRKVVLWDFDDQHRLVRLRVLDPSMLVLSRGELSHWSLDYERGSDSTLIELAPPELWKRSKSVTTECPVAPDPGLEYVEGFELDHNENGQLLSLRAEFASEQLPSAE
jgi:hypothetical protein